MKIKLKILYVLLFIFAINCKTETKQTVKQTESLIVKESDTIENREYPNQKKISKLIGKIYSKIDEIESFKGYSSGGATIGDNFKGKEYTISSIRGEGDIIKYIILEENMNYENSKIRFKILDILDLTREELLKDQNKNLYIHFCYKDGKNDQEIIAIAEYDEYAEYLTKIHKAWRADRKTEKIIEIPTTGIKVENMDYGL